MSMIPACSTHADEFINEMNSKVEKSVDISLSSDRRSSGGKHVHFAKEKSVRFAKDKTVKFRDD